MTKLNFYILLLFTSLSISSLYAQDFTIDVQYIGVEDGLLHRDIQVVFEDKNGFIWLGGIKGLQRYDGHEFKTWTKANRTGLLYYISSIGQDDEGWLWLWNNDLEQFVFLHPETEEILSVEERFGNDFPLTRKNEWLGNWASGMAQLPKSSKGQLCFGTTDGKLITYDCKQGFQTKILEKPLFTRIELIDKADNLWVTSVFENRVSKENRGIFKINASGEILEHYLIKDGFDPVNFTTHENVVYFILRQRNTSPHHVEYLKIENGAIHSTDFKVTNRRGIWAFQNKFWNRDVDTGCQVFKDEKMTQLLFDLPKGNYHPSLFESAARPFGDSRGRVWIYGDLGLNKITIQPSRFKKHFSFQDEKNRTFYNSTRGILVDGDTIYTNFERSHTAAFHRVTSEGWQVNSKNNEPRPILKKSNGDLWIGQPFHISILNAKGELVEKIHPKEGHEISGIWSFFEDKNERLWIGAGSALVFKNKNENFFQKYQSPVDDFGFIERRGAIQNMIPTKDGLVWFCSWTGLYLFDPIKEKILARYASDEEGKHYLPADLFYYLYEDQDGIFWLGTSEGLIRWEGENSVGSMDQNDIPSTQFQLFTRSQGLSNDVIYAIFEDKYNRLWMSSDYGIMSFDKETFDVKTYLLKDGISHTEFNRTSQFQTEDGTIYFGGLNGITSFHPDDFIKEEKDYPKMLISDYEIFDGKKQRLVNRVGELRKTKTINFYPDDRFFRLKFVLPTFEDISQILYAWKVEGVDEDWNYQKENNIQIGVLPYGKHTLRIKGQSGGGGWSPHEITIQVNALKPFYLQTWFILSGLFTMLASIFAFYKTRTFQLKKRQVFLEKEIQKATSQIQNDKQTIELQAEELKQLDQVKSRFFANVSHELRTPLTLMLGPISSVLKKGNLANQEFNFLKTAQQNGKDLLKLIGSILDLSKMESGKIELNETPELLFPLVRRIASNFESHAQRSNVQFIFDYQARQDLKIELDKNKLEIILNNLLSNAIKFTPIGGKISVIVEDKNNAISIQVEDSGRGIHPNDLPFVFDRFYQSKQPDAPTEGGTGIGLALSQEFIKMMNGKIWVKSELGKGSTFFVELPRKEVLGMVDTSLLDSEILKIDSETKIKSNGEKASTGEQLIPKESSKTTCDTNQTILIVEDNYSLRNYLKTILSPFYNIITAENGLAALDILTEGMNNSSSDNISLPHLILSDIMMPVMDGYQLLETLKSKDYFRQIPVVMLTARADIQDKLKALRIGVDDYLLKPFEEDELLARIENLLKNYDVRSQISLEEKTTSNGKEKASATPIISKEDEEWLKELERHLLEQLSNSQYSISQLAYDIALSERQLRRRIKQLIGLSPVQYFKEIRLQHARQLLEIRKYKTVAQTAGAVGFQDAGAFSRNFSKRFGKKPSEYLIF